MRAQDLHRPYPRCFYYLLGDDFRTWRYRFKALVERYQWTNAVANQFAFAYMRDMATQVIMDISLYGSETIEQMLDAYKDRFSLIKDFRQLPTQRGAPQGHWRRRQPYKRKSLLKPRPKRGIHAPIRQRHYVGSPGRTVRIPIHGGQLAEIALPPGAGDTGRRTATGRRVLPHNGPENSNLPGHRD